MAGSGDPPPIGPFPAEASETLVEQLGAAFSGHEEPDEDLARRIADRPALLWRERWPELRAFAAGQSSQVCEAVLGAIDVLEDFEGQMAAKRGGWAVGGGPLEQLATKVSDGLLSEDEACITLRNRDIIWRMSPDYVRRCAMRAAYLAQGEAWQFALIFGRLTLVAADEYPVENVRREMQRSAVAWWMETATAACIKVPDGAVFRHAKARGVELLQHQQEAGEIEASAQTLFNLGVLHLDPYQAGRDMANIEVELQWWRQRFVEHFGEQALEEEGRKMPDPLEALKEAAQFLGQAAEIQQGIARGRSLKARADALALTEILGGQADRPLLGQCVEEALRLLPESEFPGQVLTLRGYAKHFNFDTADGAQAVGEGTGDLDGNPSELIDREGYIAVFERFNAAAIKIASSDPDRAVALLVRLWPCLKEPQKVAAARKLLEITAQTVDATGILERNHGDYGRAAAELAGMPAEQRLAWITGLALDAVEQSREGEVLSIAKEAAEIGESEGPELGEVYRLLHAWLLTGEAVNKARKDSWDGSTGYYCDALRIFAEMDMFEGFSNILAATADAAAHEGDKGSTKLTLTLSTLGPDLVGTGIPRLGDLIHQAWLTLLASELRSGRFNPARYNLQVQAMKGAAFAAMLHSGTVYDARRDPVAMEMLRKRSAIGATEGLSDVGLHEYVLISHRAAAAEEGPTGAVERLAQKFDDHVVSSLARRRSALDAYLLEPEWSQLLDADDLLVDQVLCTDEAGASAMITGMHSDVGRRVTLGKSDLPLKYLTLTVEDRSLETNVFGLSVAQLREGLQEHPGPAVATDEAIEGLESVADYFRGAFPMLREELAKGRSHLCFVPHGPFHFCPMHLVGDGDRILADDWVITYLPHPALLRRRGRKPLTGKTGTAAFAVSFANREHGREPLPGAVSEANAVAEVMSGRAWTDSSATEERLLEALDTCRYVHIATHGQQNVFAPMLQQLFLAPSESSDGIFHAYEALGRDLAHVDMITLSACETALGRFDINDNLRGLAATLLIAGVATVISTLWPVRDSVTGHFFSSLYGHIAGGDGKLTAFRKAQLDTRRSFPAYRDWGAFTYAGVW